MRGCAAIPRRRLHTAGSFLSITVINVGGHGDVLSSTSRSTTKLVQRCCSYTLYIFTDLGMLHGMCCLCKDQPIAALASFLQRACFLPACSGPTGAVINWVDALQSSMAKPNMGSGKSLTHGPSQKGCMQRDARRVKLFCIFWHQGHAREHAAAPADARCICG